MKQAGHYGVALLLYSPVAAFLLARGNGTLAVVGGCIAIPLATAPDCDHAIPFVDHRGITHTVGFALLVGLLAGGVGWVAGSRVDATTAANLGLFAFGVSVLTVVSHLLADVITPMGVRPFRPLSGRHYTLELVLAKNWVANVVLFATGTTATLLAVFVTWGG